jgi:hypothetical protein
MPSDNHPIEKHSQAITDIIDDSPWGQSGGE